MRIGVLLHTSFVSCIALFPLISSSLAPLLFQTTEASFLKNTSDNIHYLISPTAPLRNSSRFTRNVGVGNNISLSPTVLNEDDGVSGNYNNSPRFKNPFHVIKIKPEYVRKRYELDERPTRLDEFRFYQNFNNFLKFFNYKPRREYNPYYEHFPFYHRNPFKDYESRFYRSYLPSNYGIPNFVKRFRNRQNNLVSYMHGNRGYYPEKDFAPLDSGSDATSSANAFSSTENEPSDKSKIARGISQAIAPKLENRSNRSGITPNVSTDVTSAEPLGNVTRNGLNDGDAEYFSIDDEREIQNSSHEVSTFNFNEDESDEMFLSNIKPTQFERTTLKNGFHTDKLNILANNRVYYERIPQNNNLSWFVYANCSREKCQFTNSTNETDLMNEGWTMHNCTNYGCTELYPKTESIQKFIGLILLVFSVCVLKLVVFLLVFYYCRRIKMSKQRSDDSEDPFSEDEKAFNVRPENKERGENLSMEIPSKNGAKLTVDGKFIQTKQNAGDDSHIPPKNSRHSSVQHALNLAKDNSKIWIPPKVQKVVRLKSDGDVLNRKKTLEKQKTSNPKRSRDWKDRVNTSELEKLMKSKHINDDDEKAKIWGDAVSFKESEDDRELLLMNLNEEIDTTESPTWEALLKQDSASFISLNLGDGDNSKK